VVGRAGAPSEQLMKRRARRDFWLRIGIWIFIGLFAFSVVGGLIIVTAVGRR
jgi:hypothetical protein